MRLYIDRQSTQPLYRQIEEYLRRSIESGKLPAHTRLPASRQLAHDLGVSRITVENAYAELIALGLATTYVGRGTFVLPTTKGASTDNSSHNWPLWQQSLPQYPETSGNNVAPDKDTISFAEGCGDPCLFPVDEFRKVLAKVMLREPGAALEYGETLGFSGLRDTIANVLCSQGLKSDGRDILITNGSQHAISLVAQVLLKPGDKVLVESPTYGKALELFRTLQLNVVSIAVDRDGMTTDKLEGLLQLHHPKLIYTMPNFQNPTGACLSSSRRRELITLADRYNVPILEDDFVGDLRYDGAAQPSLKSLDPGGRVIYVSTFSKMLLPGLRIGFLVANGPVYTLLAHRKEVQDLATSNLIQRALDSYISIGRYQTHLRRSCQVYRNRRNAMLLAIKRYLPDVQTDPPVGGLFFWLRLPNGITAEELLVCAKTERTAFAPGTMFHADGFGSSYIRLNFAALPEYRIEEGIRRLGVAMERIRGKER